MHAAALRIELHLPEPQSLKAKRAVLRSLVARLEKLGVAVSEVDHQNTWQRSALGVAAVAPQAHRLDEIIESVKRGVLGDPRVEVVAIETSHLEVA
jgi:hypothetical protein